MAPLDGQVLFSPAEPEEWDADSETDVKDADENVQLHWDLTEVDVQREREESVSRTEAAKAYVRMQEGVTLRINAKLAEHGEYDVLAAAQGIDGPVGPRKSGVKRHTGAVWPAGLLEGAGSPEQRHSARVVAEEILRRQDRLWKFNQRRREVLERSEQLQEQRVRDLEASELRSSQMQRARQMERQRRSFAAQQRRAEQQKALRENQREQERAFEEYYTKKQREYSTASTSSRQLSAGPSQTSLQSQSISSAPELLPGWLNEEVYKTTLTSHQNYSETIERWRQFEKENDQRTEAYKKKVMQSAGYTYRRLSTEELEMGRCHTSRGDGFRQKHLKHARRTKTTSDGYGLAATTPLPKIHSLASMASQNISAASSIKSVKSAPALTTWETRKEMCDRHQAEKVQLGLERLQRSQESLQEARQRVNAINKERVDKANEMNQTWKDRTETAARKRAQLALRSDEDLAQRLEEHTRKREEEMRATAEHRSDMAEAKKDRIREAQLAAQQLQERSQQRAQEKLMQKAESSQTNVMLKLQEFEERAGNQEFEDVARMKHEKKRSQSEEFRRKAQQELEAKESRSQNALMLKRLSPLERLRAQRRERSPLGRSQTLLTPPHAQTSASLSPVATPASGSRTTRQDNGSPSSPSAGAATSVPLLRGEEPTSGAPSPASPAAAQNLADLLSSQLGGSAEVEAALQRQESDTSVGDPDDERAFLKQLESRSAKWLQDLRKKKEKERVSWKP